MLHLPETDFKNITDIEQSLITFIGLTTALALKYILLSVTPGNKAATCTSIFLICLGNIIYIFAAK